MYMLLGDVPNRRSSKPSQQLLVMFLKLDSDVVGERISDTYVCGSPGSFMSSVKKELHMKSVHGTTTTTSHFDFGATTTHMTHAHHVSRKMGTVCTCVVSVVNVFSHECRYQQITLDRL